MKGEIILDNETNSFNWGSFIIGILFIGLSLIAFNEPTAGLAGLVYFFAFVAIIKGIFEIIYRNRMKYFTMTNKTGLVVLGILEIIIGVVLFFNVFIGIFALPFILGFWFIIDSVGTLFVASSLRDQNRSMYWFTIVFGVIGLILGILLLLNPITGLFTVAFLVGAYFMFAGIVAIVEAF